MIESLIAFILLAFFVLLNIALFFLVTYLEVIMGFMKDVIDMEMEKNEF